MKNFKRIFAMVLAIAMLSVFFTACGDDDNGGESTPGTTTEPSNSQIVIPTFTTKPKDDGKVTYTVTVVDQNNNPVPGVAIQFCSGENCKLPSNTDENGVLVQKYPAAEYYITLVELPAGYSAEETKFYFGEETELTVVINAD